MTRTLKGNEPVKPNTIRAAQGRPLDVLCAFLKEGRACNVKTKQDHKALTFTHMRRIRGRAALKVNPLSKPLFDAERPKRDGEDSEPEQEPGSVHPPVLGA